MNDTEKLLAIEEIKKLKARYFRAVDTKDIELFRSVFVEDVICDFRGSATDPATGINYAPEATAEAHTSVKTVLDGAEAFFSTVISVHHGHMPEIEIIGTDTAKGIWAMVDLLQFTTPGSPAKGMDGYGHYHETYVKLGGEWKIKTLKLTRLRLDFHPA